MLLSTFFSVVCVFNFVVFVVAVAVVVVTLSLIAPAALAVH